MSRALVTLGVLLCLTGPVSAAPWQYRNAQYGFTVQLPSSNWKQVPFPGGLVAFRDKSTAAEVGVQIRPETDTVYRTTLRNFQHLTGTLPNLLQKPRQEQGQTPGGNAFSYLEVIEMSPEHDRPMVVAFSHVRLQKQSMTVITTFQGHLSVKNNHMNRSEINRQEAQAKTICLSVAER